MKYLHNSHILSAHSWMMSRSPHQYTGGTHSLHRSATFRAQYGTILQTFQRYSPVLWARAIRLVPRWATLLRIAATQEWPVSVDAS